MNKPALFFAPLIAGTVACGAIQPGQNPRAMALEVPVEKVRPAHKAQEEEKEQPGGTSIRPSVEMQFISSTRNDLSAICAELKKGGLSSQCSGEVFQNISDDSPDAGQFRQLRNRCLALMAECENASGK